MRQYGIYKLHGVWHAFNDTYRHTDYAQYHSAGTLCSRAAYFTEDRRERHRLMRPHEVSMEHFRDRPVIESLDEYDYPNCLICLVEMSKIHD